MIDSLSSPAALLLGLLAGALVALLFGVPIALGMARRRHAEGAATRQGEIDALDARADELHAALDARGAELGRERERLQRLEQQLHAALREHAELKGRLGRSDVSEQQLRARDEELAGLRTQLQETLAEQARLRQELLGAAAQVEFLDKVRGEFGDAFKALAGEILHERGQRLAADNASQLGQLLQPVREQLRGFQEAVQQAYVQEACERSLLAREIEALKALNHQLGDEAANLARALHGDTRVQGAWGELVLERVLEVSGLVAGREYRTQVVLRDEDGGRPRPDVLVHLPQGRELVIDAKVSLTAYARAVDAASEAERGQALAEHLASLRRHVDGLAARDYTALLDGRALDFVLLFVPIESALVEAVRRDPGLYEYALAKDIAIVSPSTLLATLRAASHLWRQEQRNRNAQEIAQRAGKLYDKFVAFVDDLDKVREALARAQRHVDLAFLKLSQGSGNLVRQAEQLRELGARNSKTLPAELLGDAETS